MSSACTWPRQTRRWCSAATRKVRCKPWNARSLGYLWGIGHIQTKSHDYTRHGTVTLFAALDYIQGKLISSIERQHRHQAWLAFLKKIDKETPKHLQLHLIVAQK